MRTSCLLLAAVVGFVSVGCKRSAPGEQPVREETVVPVAAVAAQRGRLRAVVRASGIVVPAEGAEFLAVAPEPARIVEVTKMPGDPVGGGEVVVRFDLPFAVQEVSRQRAELARAQARFEDARLAHDRVRGFVERGLVPRQDLDTANRELAAAQTEVDRAQAAQEAADAAAGREIVRAPFDGIVVARLHNPGDLAQAVATDPILRIVDPRRLEIMATVPAADMARVLPGATARVAGPTDGRPVPLTVAPDATNAAGGDATVRLLFAEPPPIPVETRVEVEIDAEERDDVVFVPAEAVVRERDQSVVMVAVGNKAERRAVTIGIADARRVEILSGVRSEELVITRGHIGLADGEAISVAVNPR